jgi:hypothetical protein
MASRLLTTVLAVSQLPTAFAWGDMGHKTIAYIAQNFVASSTATYFQTLLGDTSTGYLANVATWADSYRYTTAGAFSKQFHFIDAKDDPPSSCSVSYSRDCPENNCVVGAIANYTSQLLAQKASKASLVDAAKFVIHFVGDIGQPLHCENLDVGGNDIGVTYGAESTNLHHIWDTEIPEGIAGGSTLSTAQSYAATLTTAIASGTYKSAAAGWVAGLSVTSAQATALQWASEANAYVCSTVLAKGLSYLENSDLSGSYATTATPVVDGQIAKQGYRYVAPWPRDVSQICRGQFSNVPRCSLAKWLDAIVAGMA